MFKAVIFDMDGTLLDTEPIAELAWTRAMAHYGYEMTPEFYLQLIGRNQSDTIKILRNSFGEDFNDQIIVPRVREEYDRELETNGVKIKSGAAELLEFLGHRKIARAVATSSRRRRAVPMLELVGLYHHFHTLVGGDEVPRGKPEPDIFLEAANRLGVAAKDCLAIEDSEAGVSASLAAGMTTVMIPDRVQPAEELRKRVHYVVNSMNELSLTLFKGPATRT